LKIEREAVKKDTSEAAVKQVKLLDEQITTVQQEFGDLEEVWVAEKAQVQGSAQIKSEIEQAKMELEAAHRSGDLARMSEIQYGVIPELEKRLEVAEGDDQPEPTLLRSRVTEDEVAEVVSRWTGIPVSKMLEGRPQSSASNGVVAERTGRRSE
jgi:ATP-dependent Clp protease ATP-binding subunit ClpB